MSKIVTPITVQVVTFNTPVHFKEVVARLEAELNRDGSPDTIESFMKAESPEDWMATASKKAAGKEFQFFSEFPHTRILKALDPEGASKAEVTAYMFGNPLFAKEIMKYNPLAAYSIPPRFLIVGKPDGTTVTYHQPSTVMAAPSKENDPALLDALRSLDTRLEKLAERITAV